MKKKIIIIGAGVSGMTAGIYALDNGYDVTIYEKHNIPGGQCTGWYRKGVFIDGCAHWIVGTNPTSDLYPLWRHVGAFDLNSTIYDTEYFCKYDIDGEIVTFYANDEKLKEELIRVAPEDKKQIKRFVNGINAYKHIKVPVKKPIDQMNLFELIEYGFAMLPVAIHFAYYKHITVEKYLKKFKSPIIREVFHRFFGANYNVHSMTYVMQALAKNDAGVIEGGSKVVADSIANTFIKNGGTILYNKNVDHILIENNVAKGVVLENGEVIYADYVIASSDAYHTMTKLLENKYQDKYYEDRFNNREDYPLSTSLLLSYKVNKILYNHPKMISFKIYPVDFVGMSIDEIKIRNHSFDSSLNKNISTITILINTPDFVYDNLSTLSKEKYNEAKQELGEKIKKEVIAYLGIEEDSVTLIDVATPLTYERYTNAYRGSYMSFITTDKSKGLMRKGLIKGLNNFAMAGQWIMPPGGLPIALFTGKHAVCRICKMDKKNFVDLDYLYSNEAIKKDLREPS